MPPVLNSEKKHALITGAASGLGRAFALQLARQGWHLALADIDDEGSRETLRQVKAVGGSGEVFPLDVAKYEEWQSLVAQLRASWPRLDLLVNNAGVACSGEIGVTPIEDWHWLLGINLTGVIHGCHTCIGWLKQNPNGARIINIASAAGFLAAPGMAAYNVAKAGVIALSETLAAELRGTGVTVTVACPGFFRTRLLDRARFQTNEERAAADWYTRTSPLNADQVAAQILKAATRRRPYIVLPARARWPWYFKRLAPRAWLRLVSFVYRRQKFKGSSEVTVETFHNK